MNPFTVLGLPEWPDLDDATVRAAWNKIAADTSPARPDGGDLAKYAQASAAFAQLDTPAGRAQAEDMPPRPAHGNNPATENTPAGRTLNILPALLNPSQDGYDDTAGATDIAAGKAANVEGLFESPTTGPMFHRAV